MLKHHIYWTNFFQFLEENIMTDVYLMGGGFSGNTIGKYSFSVIGDSFSTITNQIKVLKNNKDVYEVIVNSGSLTSYEIDNTDDETTEEENATSTEIVLEEIEELTDYSSESKVGFGMQISINPSIFTR